MANDVRFIANHAMFARPSATPAPTPTRGQRRPTIATTPTTTNASTSSAHRPSGNHTKPSSAPASLYSDTARNTFAVTPAATTQRNNATDDVRTTASVYRPRTSMETSPRPGPRGGGPLSGA